MIKRKIEEIIFKILMYSAFAAVLFSFIIIIFTILAKGIPSLNLKMITQTPKGGYYLGREGGILNAITGSLILACSSTFLSMMISIPIAIFLNVYNKKNSTYVQVIRFSFDVLTGVPSIVYGALGLIIMYFFNLRASLLGGTIAVSLLILPLMCRGIDEVLQMTPKSLLESSYALGSTKLETSFKILIRQCYPGIITTILISFGRGIGDAASVLFTAGFSDNMPGSFLRPAATLPLAIFFQLTSPIREVQNRAYAAAIILTVIILIISIASRLISLRFEKYKIK